MKVENNVSNNNSVNHIRENVTLENLPTELLEMIFSNVPTLDSNYNLPDMRLISKDINHTITYSENERIQEVFKNLLNNNNLEKDIEEIKEIINFCKDSNCYRKSLSNAYLQASIQSKASESEDSIKKFDEISNQISSSNILKFSLMNNEEKQIIFINACRLGHIKIIKDFIEQGFVDPSAEDNEAIRKASENGHTEIVELLLKDGRVDPSAKKNEAFRLALINGHKEVYELLLQDPRVDPSSFENFAIRWASFNGKKEVVDLLLQDRRVDPSVCNSFAIRMAASEKIKTILIEWAQNNPNQKGSAEILEFIREN